MNDKILNNDNVNTYIEIGVDEAGRGPCAGKLYVSAFYICKDKIPMIKWYKYLNDSKKVKAELREETYNNIKTDEIEDITCKVVLNNCEIVVYSSSKFIYSYISIPVELIDTMNILQATLFGMGECAKAVILTILEKFDHNEKLNFSILVDGNKIPNNLAYNTGTFCPNWIIPYKNKIKKINVKSIVKGDSKILCISAASFVAKVERDNHMRSLAEEYPLYNFDIHKGYPTLEHRTVIYKYGPTNVHRLSFEPCYSLLASNIFKVPSGRIFNTIDKKKILLITSMIDKKTYKNTKSNVADD